MVAGGATTGFRISASGLRHRRFPDPSAAAQDGRKPSVWDAWSHMPGKTANGDTGDIACDHYHLYKQDVQLLKSLGVKTYRFSVASPRVVPDGSGPANGNGAAFDERLVDELLSNGIQVDSPPCITGTCRRRSKRGTEAGNRARVEGLSEYAVWWPSGFPIA